MMDVRCIADERCRKGGLSLDVNRIYDDRFIRSDSELRSSNRGESLQFGYGVALDAESRTRTLKRKNVLWPGIRVRRRLASQRRLWRC